MNFKLFLLVLVFAVCPNGFVGDVCAQLDFQDDQEFTRQDRLRGSITPEREWWDLQHYHLSVEVLPETKSLIGSNKVAFSVLEPGKRMQIDLQEPLSISKVVHGEDELKFEREGSVYWIDFPKPLEKGSDQLVEVFYAGVPVESENPPWSGGISWQKDDFDNHFIASSCQGIGASIWWPTKDHGYDEPDQGMNISITVPDNLVAVSNGRLNDQVHDEENGKKTFHWVVTNPINNYCINVNVGNYVNFSDKFAGENGELDLDYWVLEHQREKAIEHFKESSSHDQGVRALVRTLSLLRRQFQNRGCAVPRDGTSKQCDLREWVSKRLPGYRP